MLSSAWFSSFLQQLIGSVWPQIRAQQIWVAYQGSEWIRSVHFVFLPRTVVGFCMVILAGGILVVDVLLVLYSLMLNLVSVIVKAMALIFSASK